MLDTIVAMRSILIAMVIAGCGGSKAPPPPAPAAPPPPPPPADAASPESAAVEAALSKFEGLADEMCQCKTKDCVKKVSDEITAWGNEQVKLDLKPTDEQANRLETSGRRLGDCMQKIK